MPLDLEDAKRPKTRWVPFDGHLSGIEILVRFYGTEERQKFSNRLESLGITRPSRDEVFRVNAGREGAFFREWATKFILDWRVADGYPPDTMKPEGAPYDSEKMGRVLAEYPRAFEILTKAVADENAFFEPEVNGSTPT